MSTSKHGVLLEPHPRTSLRMEYRSLATTSRTVVALGSSRNSYLHVAMNGDERVPYFYVVQVIG